MQTTDFRLKTAKWRCWRLGVLHALHACKRGKCFRIKPRPHQQQCRINVRLCRSNIGLRRKNRSTCSIRQYCFDVVAAWVWTGLYLILSVRHSVCPYITRELEEVPEHIIKVFPVPHSIIVLVYSHYT